MNTQQGEQHMSERLLALLCCPVCKADITKGKIKARNMLVCTSCKQQYPFIGDIPSLLPPLLQEEDATIKHTYEQQSVAEKFGIESSYTGSVKYRNIMREKAASLVAMFAPKNGIVLDSGCGNGLLLEKIVEKRPDVTIIGLDISLPMVQQAQKRNRSKTIWFLAGSLHALPLKSSSVDTTVCIDVLHHFPASMSITAMDELFRVTKHSGLIIMYFIISTAFDTLLSVGNSMLQFFMIKPKVKETPLAGIHAHKVTRAFLSSYLHEKSAQWKLHWVSSFLNWALVVARRRQ